MTQPAAAAARHLRRGMGMWSATALVVSNMIGTGIFTSTGFMAGDLGSARMILLAWLVGAGFAFCGALVYSELAINHPQSGGEYVYLTNAYGPSWGFMSGWVSFFAGFSAPVAAAALAFSDYLAHFLPFLGQSHTAFVLGSGDWTVSVGSVASVFFFRRRPDWRSLRSVSFAYPLIPLAYCLLGAGTTVYGLIWQPKASIAALEVIGVGALVYHFSIGRGAVESGGDSAGRVS